MTEPKETIVVYITKTALSQGILKKECQLTEVGGVKYATQGAPPNMTYVYARFGVDAFLTEAEARTKVAVMARARLGAIEKDRARIAAILAEMEDPQAVPQEETL